MDPSGRPSSFIEVAEDVPKETIPKAEDQPKDAESNVSYLFTQSDGAKKRKRVRSKKPKDMPRRPLSAYNIFFKEQKGRLQGEPQARKKSKFGFEELGKKIGALWKQLCPEEMQIYQDQASVEMLRYQKEMEQYQSKLAKKEFLKEEKRSLNISDSLYAKAEAACSAAVVKSAGGAVQDSGSKPLADVYLHKDRSNLTGHSPLPGMGLGTQHLHNMAMEHLAFPRRSSFPQQNANFDRERSSHPQLVGGSDSMPVMAFPQNLESNISNMPNDSSAFRSEIAVQSQYISNVPQGLDGVSHVVTHDNRFHPSMQSEAYFGNPQAQLPSLPGGHQFHSLQHQMMVFEPPPIVLPEQVPLDMGVSLPMQQSLSPYVPVPFPFDETVGERDQKQSWQGVENEVDFDFSGDQQFGQDPNHDIF